MMGFPKKLLKGHFTAKEIDLAHDIQEYLLPKSFPFSEKLECGTIYEPAKPIGGDFYDVIQIDQRRAALMIGDTSGYSIPASLFMTQCYTILKTLVKMDLSLLKIVETANEILFDIAKPNMFVTLFIGIYDSFYNQLSYVNAGHPPPILIRSTGKMAARETNSTIGLTAEGMALNCSRKLILEEKRQQLLSGDLLFLYTDGIIEAFNQQLEPIGEPTIRRLLHESKDLPASQIAKKILDSIETYSKGATNSEDDKAALIIKLRES